MHNDAAAGVVRQARSAESANTLCLAYSTPSLLYLRHRHWAAFSLLYGGRPLTARTRIHSLCAWSADCLCTWLQIVGRASRRLGIDCSGYILARHTYGRSLSHTQECSRVTDVLGLLWMWALCSVLRRRNRLDRPSRFGSSRRVTGHRGRLPRAGVPPVE